MSWLTWRLQRTTMITAAALVAVFAAAVATLRPHEQGDSTLANWLLVLGPPAFATVVAVFWGAPMVAREYEHRTYLLVWSRDRPATRWLVARVGQLLAPLVVLTFAVNAVASLLYERMFSVLTPNNGNPTTYDLWPPLQLATVLAAFGIGVLVGVLARNSVTAMGITLVGYVALRFALGVFARPHLLPAMRLIDTPRPIGAMYIGGGYLDQAGHEVSMLDAQDKCMAAASRAAYQQCLTRNGLVHEYVDVQPADRIPDVRLVEFGIYVALAVVAFAAAWLVLRRRMVA